MKSKIYHRLLSTKTYIIACFYISEVVLTIYKKKVNLFRRQNEKNVKSFGGHTLCLSELASDSNSDLLKSTKRLVPPDDIGVVNNLYNMINEFAMM